MLRQNEVSLTCTGVQTYWSSRLGAKDSLDLLDDLRGEFVQDIESFDVLNDLFGL